MLSMREVSGLHHVVFRNSERCKGRRITGVSTDTRTLQRGELFIAIRGENFDGHKFLGDAFNRGASMAIVQDSASLAQTPDSPVMVVEDSVLTLGALARLYRKKFSLPIIAVAGSNGKTTTKDMIAAVLGSRFNVLSTEGNHNNHIGVPQTLFRLRRRHDVAVLELGTNHPGEIDALCRIAEPTHGLITNIAREHLEFFNSLEGVAEEEGALFQDLSRRSASVAFINSDDELVRKAARRTLRRKTYGMSARSVDLKGKITSIDARGCARLEIKGKNQKGMEIQLGIPGRHNAMNALAAAAVGGAFRVPKTAIRDALVSFQPASRRMEVLQLEGVTVYNDSYNANADSMIAALRTLADARVPGKKIAVLGEMRELGAHSVEEHREVGREVTKLGIPYLLTFGDLAREIHGAARVQSSVHYDQKNMLAEFLAELVAPGDAVLIKGSRGLKMEDVVAFLEVRLRSRKGPVA